MPDAPAWKANGLALSRTDANHWKATLQASPGTSLQYKYTLGDWAFVEKSADGKELPNRTLTFSGASNQFVSDSVANWNGIGGGATSRVVNLTLNATVPASTEATHKPVCLAGTLDRFNGGWPVWSPSAVQLTRVSATQWRIQLSGKEGGQVMYKYTLGDWSFVEKAGDCSERANRTVILTYGSSGDQTVNDTVQNWRNVPPCGN